MQKRYARALCLVLACLAAEAACAAAPVTLQQRFAYATRAVDASRITHRNFIGGINNRLTVVHEMAYENPDEPGGPLSTALYEPVDRLWIGGVGAGAELKGVGGYKYDAYGFNTGYDWSRGDLTLGLAASYTLGNIDSNEIDTRNRVESINFAAYASHDPLFGLFYDMNATYGMSWNRSLSMSVAEGIGAREGKFRATSYGLGGNIGYGFDLPLAKVTPTIGLQWTRHEQEMYAEFAHTVTPHWFAEAENDFIEIPLAVRVGTSWQLGSGTVLSPELRAAYILTAGDGKSAVTAGPLGGAGIQVQGADDGKNRMRVGGGLKANFNPTFDAFVDYSLEFKSGYRSTNFNTGLGLSF